MKNLFILFIIQIFSLYAYSAGTGNQSNAIQPVNDSIKIELTLVWATDSTQFATPECVTYDPERGVLYVSNANRANNIENGGYISIVNIDGTIKEAKWIEGLGAPLGNEIYDGFLYVNDRTEIVKINITTGEIANRIQVTGATWLNGLDIDRNGNIYSADINGNRIFKITQDGEVSIVVESDELNRPNGVLSKDNELLIASFGASKLLSINLESKEIKSKVEGLENADGVVLLEGGNYLVSSSSGLIHFISKDLKVQKILDTKGRNINAADITFVPKENLIIVPTFNDNRLMAYKMEIYQ